MADSQPAISAISEIELLCWKTTIEKDQEVLHNFIADAWVSELEKDIKLKTAELRRAHKIKLPDAIIAATALVYDLTWLTRDVNDFKNIDELNVVTPHDIPGTQAVRPTLEGLLDKTGQYVMMMLSKLC